MGHMMYVFASVARMDPNYFCSRCGLKLFRSRGSDEDLGRWDETREVNEVTQGNDLSNSLNGTFSKNGKETYAQAMVSILLWPLDRSCKVIPTMSSWNPLLLDVYESMNLILRSLATERLW
jgi:predicted ATP-dependent serine protease